MVPIVVACCDLGLRLVIRCASGKNAHEPALSRRHPANLVIGPARLRRLWAGPESPGQFLTPQELERAGQRSVAEWEVSGWLGRESAKLALNANGHVEPAWITHSTLLKSAANFHLAYPLSAGEKLLTTSSALTAEGLGMSVIIPIILGMSTVLADTALLDNPAAYWRAAERVGATICENPANGFQLLLDADRGRNRQIPNLIRLLLTSSGIVAQSCHQNAQRAWQRRICQGYGTAEHGFWLAHNHHSDPADVLHIRKQALSGIDLAIRKMRVPLALLSDAGGDQADCGEIVFQRPSPEALPPAKPKSAGEFRTGDLGQLTATGDLIVRHRLADVAVRDGSAVLLTEVDALLRQHDAVTASKTFREQPNSPLSRIIAACVTEAPSAELREWLADRVGPRWLPDEIVPVHNLPHGPALDVQVDTLRAMVSGSACNDLVAALTARKFRRNPCYKEPELRQLIQSAILALRPIEFFMFWGCGPRHDAATPDRVALAALEDILDTVGRVAPIQARAVIILTDLHARNNGYHQEHYNAYFAAIERAAAGLNVTFRRESEIWARGGLSMERVGRFAASTEFEAKWQVFPLQDRFMTQASRHSKMADRAEAARRYYAICLLEREVLKAAFQQSVFLTYNGPEFNDCFPDLPTLYVYPGPRGRTDKPWFIQAVPDPAEAAEAQAPLPIPIRLAS